MRTKSPIIIARMARYKHAVERLKMLGFSKVFSKYLGETVNATSVQIRKDFSIFGIKGSKRGGYNVDELLEQLTVTLGGKNENKIIVVGCGNLGTSLLNYRGFNQKHFDILATFDIDPAKINNDEKIPTLPLDQLENFIKKESIKTAIITVPEQEAQSIYDRLLKCGIRGIMNFAPIQLKSTGECVVNNVNLYVELESILYFVNNPENEE
jgi:redox-sensing transcriptional repressor